MNIDIKKELEAVSMGDIVHVHAQNVYDYFYKHYQEHGWDDLKNFVCCRAPFKKMRISYDAASFVKDKRLPDIRTAVYVTEINEIDFVGAPKGSYVEEGLRFLEKIREMPHKFLVFETELEGVRLPHKLIVPVGEDGRVIEHDGLAYVEIVMGPSNEHYRHIIHRDCTISMATINFMNCRNVELVDNKPLGSWVRKAARRGDPPPVTYKTLVLHPFGKKNRLVQKQEARPGSDVALHIVRGHFKDYRSGVGLGRAHVKGLWWWGPQVRGTSERVVEKAYDVQPERKGEGNGEKAGGSLQSC